MTTIPEPSRHIPVIAEADVCVAGGSCTGVFAAVRAARLGASVILVERSNCFGGVATNGLVLVWHSLMDTTFERPIMAGLTAEIVARLERVNAVEHVPRSRWQGCRLNTEELKIELDALVREHRIRPMLHTMACRPLMDGNRIAALAVESKDGRGAIRAGMFVDATGDGDVAARAGVPYVERDGLQPPTTVAKIRNYRQAGIDFRELYQRHHQAFGLEPDAGWDSHIPGIPDIQAVLQTHVFGVNTAREADLTQAEMEGRRHIRAIMDMLRTHGSSGDDIALVQLASAIGVRETRVIEAAHCLTEDEVLYGKRFDDAIANGSYCVDVHPPSGGGFLFKFLDGTMGGLGQGRWRDPLPEDPTYYQIPYRCMIHPEYPNLICAGRMICTDRNAFGAVRVMVNLNQVGEAAGTAAVLALEADSPVTRVDPSVLRRTLADGGSLII